MKTSRSNYVLSLGAAIAALLLTASAQAAPIVIVDDSFADGDRAQTNTGGELDTSWYTSASSSGLDDPMAVGRLGLVTGTSGRGIHTVFPTQTLAVGDVLKASYTFLTPATVGASGNALKVGLFDTLGRPLNADISASSGSPNPLYGFWFTDDPGLPGWMMDMDVNTGATADLNVRRSETADNDGHFSPSGRLLGTNTGFTSIGDSDDAGYTFVPNTSYSGSLSFRKISPTEMKIVGTLGSTYFSVTDTIESSSFGFLGFWANSNAFGSTSDKALPDNGIDFTNVKIERLIPEPASLALFLGALISFPGLIRRK